MKSQLFRSKCIASTCIACAFLTTPFALFAQTKISDTEYGVGLGVIPSDEGYKGIGLKSTVIPAVRIQTPRFSLRGTSAEFMVTHPENQVFSVNLRADLLLQGYKAKDGAIFTGMARRDPSLLVGVGVKYTTPVGQFWAETGMDATGNSKGMRSEVGVGWRISTDSAIGNWTFSPYLSAQLNNAKLTNYYFGVSQSEATASRPAYQAGSATNLNLGVSAVTNITPSVTLLMGARYRYYGQSIRQSPLVDSNGGISGNVSLMYRF
ncbi:MAG TPA: MipA/OmpV family protein [Burkholderiaceae bacterium]|nr:MipA/OmpV family protein [Burkholderiaceae bacterium]